jgi:hypothetical protein
MPEINLAAARPTGDLPHVYPSNWFDPRMLDTVSTSRSATTPKSSPPRRIHVYSPDRASTYTATVAIVAHRAVSIAELLQRVSWVI